MSLHANMYLPEVAQPAYENTLLLLPNEQGAALADYHGALSEYLAQEIGMRVLAFERPFSADQAVFSLSRRRHINAEYPVLASRTARELNKIASQEGVSQVVTAGHSAGGLFALAMIASEQLPVSGSFVTDPPAIRRSTPLKAELIEYGGYQLFTERRKPQDDLPLNPVPANLPPVSQLVQRHMNEIAEYSGVYCSTLGFETLHRIAAEMPAVGVKAAFPEFTFVAKPTILRHLRAQSQTWRTDSGAMPFSIDIIENAYHSTFSNHHFFGNLLRQALTELIVP